LLLALDYGGTKHSAAILIQGERVWAARQRTESPLRADATRDQSTMLRLARGLLDQVPGALVAVGVSFGGPVDAASGVVRLSHHVPGWENVALRSRLEEEFGVAVAIDNDANAAALGEARVGAGTRASSLLYVTVSTGIGGGWVIKGEVWHGADGMAGEIGHTVVRRPGNLCDCGRRGCLEAHASGRAITREARSRILAEPSRGSALLHYAGGDIAMVTAESVARLAEKGDQLSGEILDEASGALAEALANAINLMNPDVVVVGGGVSKSGPRFWRRILQVAREMVLPQTQVKIVPAALGDDAPLWGAIHLAEDRLSQG
jgi:glucokinase